MNYECIMGAFAKFAFFETRIFFNETQPSGNCFNRFRFFHGFYIYECIMGAFAKFAIFETSIFFKTRRSQVKCILTDFVFFSRF